MERLVCILIGYLFGCVLTANIVARQRTGRSAFDIGSGNPGMANCQTEMKKAVDCGYWNLYRFNPAAEPGKKFSLDSKEPKGGYQEFLMNEARYSRLTREFPERAEGLFAKSEENAKARYEHLQKLKAMFDA